MSSEYTKSILKIVVAQINQTIGWNSIQSTPLEILVSLLQRYLEEVAKLTHRYAEQCKYIIIKYFQYHGF